MNTGMIEHDKLSNRFVIKEVLDIHVYRLDTGEEILPMNSADLLLEEKENNLYGTLERSDLEIPKGSGV